MRWACDVLRRRGMRKPQFIPPNSTVEVTIRTSGGKNLLRPTLWLNTRIVDILGRALSMHPVQLHAFQFMSNHVHILLTGRDGKLISEFLKHLDRNVSVAVRMLHGDEAVWNRRPKIITVLGHRAALRRLRYICSNGVKEGLVGSPLEWPGVSSARALLEGSTIVTTWQTAADRRRARRHGVSVDHPDYGEVNVIELVPLPSLTHLTQAERCAFYARMFAEITAEGVALRNGRRPLGREAILAQDPHARHTLERTPAPLVHASNRLIAHRYLLAERTFVSHYRTAARAFAAGQLDVPFPHGAFPPRRPFVSWPAGATPCY